MYNSFHPVFFHFFHLVFLLCIPLTANAKPSFPTNWQTIYPASESYSNAGCQLCHQNSSGGNGWNAYGWAVRESIVTDGNSIENALENVEENNSDLDSTGASNLTEIDQSTQPGWTTGSVNTIYFEDGSTLVDQAPPDLAIELDPPVLVSHDIIPPSILSVQQGEWLGPFSIEHSNNSDTTVTYTVQSYLIFPDETIRYGTERTFYLDPQQSRNHDAYLYVPSNALTGTHTLGAIITYTESGEVDEDSFDFTVTYGRVITPGLNDNDSSFTIKWTERKDR